MASEPIAGTLNRTGGAVPGAGAGGGSGAQGRDNLGASIALSYDGSIALVGAPNANAGHGLAYLFRIGGTSQTIKPYQVLHPSDSDAAGFGSSVALSASGFTVLVRAPTGTHGGAVYVYKVVKTTSGMSWAPACPLAPSGFRYDGFGVSVALNQDIGAKDDGSIALVGAPNGAPHGEACVYCSAVKGLTEHDLTVPYETTTQFGQLAALSHAGSTVLVAAGHTGATYLFGYVFGQGS